MNVPKADVAETMCAECGQVEDYTEMKWCRLHGEHTLICLRCYANFVALIKRFG